MSQNTELTLWSPIEDIIDAMPVYREHTIALATDVEYIAAKMVGPSHRDDPEVIALSEELLEVTFAAAAALGTSFYAEELYLIAPNSDHQETSDWSIPPETVEASRENLRRLIRVARDMERYIAEYTSDYRRFVDAATRAAKLGLVSADEARSACYYSSSLSSMTYEKRREAKRHTTALVQEVLAGHDVAGNIRRFNSAFVAFTSRK